MNLKEAFRFQNSLQSMMETAQAILEDDGNTTQTRQTALRSRVMPEAEDETTLLQQPSEYADRINDVTAFWLWLLSEHEKLSRAIRRAKNALPLDMDSEISLNRQRQALAKTLHHMAQLKSSERLLSGAGRGYRFNAEGNQVTYTCDLKQVVTIHFDRTKVRNTAAEMDRRAEKISADIDQCLVNSNVDYALPFSVNDNFDEAFEIFMAAKS